MQRFFHIFIFIGLTLISGFALAQSTRYVVKAGDSLSKIAKDFYSDPSKWTHIYRANKNLIKDAERIRVGWNLIIPKLEDVRFKVEVTQDVEKDKEASAIRLVTGNEYFPFTDEKLPGDGMITEIVMRAFEEMGKSTELEFWSWKHGYDATKEGAFVATFPYFKDPEREKDFYFSKPLFDILLHGFVRKDSSIKYENPKDLHGLSICRPEGYTISYLQDLLDQGILTLKQPKDMKTCFQLLNDGSVHIVSTDEFEAKGIMLKEFGSVEAFKTLDKSFSEGPLHLIFPKSKPENLYLLYEFDQILEKMAKDRTLQKITKRHLMYYKALLEE